MTSTALIMLALMNAARVDHPLVLAPDLSAKAGTRAKYFCDRPLSHDGWEAYFQGTRYQVMGENLAKGFKSPNAAVDGLLHSPPHRANILKRDYTQVGIGEACGVVVQFFGG